MQKKVSLYVYDSLSDWEYGYLAPGINDSTFQNAPERLVVETCASSLDPITTAGGIRIAPDALLQNVRVEECAMFVLCGGSGWDGDRHDLALSVAEMFIKAQVPVAAICGATLGLAKRGFLNTVNHTSNAPEFLHLGEYRGQDRYQEALAVSDQNIITASGIAPVEFARSILEALHLYAPEILEAWFKPHTTKQAVWYYKLCELAYS